MGLDGARAIFEIFGFGEVALIASGTVPFKTTSQVWAHLASLVLGTSVCGTYLGTPAVGVVPKSIEVWGGCAGG